MTERFKANPRAPQQTWPTTFMIVALLWVSPVARATAPAPEPPAPSAQDTAREQITIVLSGSVRLVPGTPVTVGAIANLRGGRDPETLRRIATIELAPSVDALPAARGRWRIVTPQDVRGAVSLSPGFNLGRIAVSGSQVFVAERASATRSKAAADPDVVEPKPTTTPPTTLNAAAGTIGASLLATLAATLDLLPAELRVTHAPADAELLAEPLYGRAVTTRPTGIGSRTPVAITIFEAGRVIDRGTITVGVEVRRLAATLKRAVRRGDAVTDASFATAEVWMSPADAPADPAHLSGRIAKRTLHPGSQVLSRDTVPATVIERGDIVVVHSVARSVIVALKGRALDDGAEGDLVMLELPGQERGQRKRVQARVSGPGTAVLTQRSTPAPSTTRAPGAATQRPTETSR